MANHRTRLTLARREDEVIRMHVPGPDGTTVVIDVSLHNITERRARVTVTAPPSVAINRAEILKPEPEYPLNA